VLQVADSRGKPLFCGFPLTEDCILCSLTFAFYSSFRLISRSRSYVKMTGVTIRTWSKELV